MKKIVLLVTILLTTSAVAFAGISATKHNLTSSSPGTTKTTDPNATLCGFCHTPHGANAAIPATPLWARGMPTGPYTVYGMGVTSSGTPVNQPGAASMVCLSCHDGTIGLGVTYKNGVQATNYVMTTGLGNGAVLDPDYSFSNWVDPTTGYSPNIAPNGDLTNDHPVGLVYDATKAGLDSLVNVKQKGYKLYGQNQDQVECASCHDPHISTTQKFKRNVTASDFCVGCHMNK